MQTDTHIPQPPNTAEEYCSRGMDRLRTGNFKDAIDDFTQAIRLRPDVASGYRYRAIAHAESGNVTRAIADLDQAIRLKPDDVQALYDRGQFFPPAAVRRGSRRLQQGRESRSARADLLPSAAGSTKHAAVRTGGRGLLAGDRVRPSGAAGYLIMRGDCV